MNEINLQGYTENDIIDNIKKIDWNNYKLPAGSIIEKEEINLVKNITKFKYFDRLPVNNPAYFAIVDGKLKLKMSLFLYDPIMEAMQDANIQSVLCENATKLKQKYEEVFFVKSRIIDLEQIFDAIDNQEGDISVYESKTLRAKKLKMLENFFDDVGRFFLSIMMDFLYDCHNMRFLGIPETEAALKAARPVFKLISDFEADFKREYIGDKVYKEIDEEIPDPTQTKKTYKKPSSKKPKTKKPIKVEDKFE